MVKAKEEKVLLLLYYPLLPLLRNNATTEGQRPANGLFYNAVRMFCVEMYTCLLIHYGKRIVF